MLRAAEIVRAYQIVWNENGNLSDVKHEDGILLLTDICADREPLIVQICGNHPETLEKATRVLLELNDKFENNLQIQGVDLNLGCPQNCALEGGFGAFLAEEHPDLAVACVAAMKRAIKDYSPKRAFRLSCKIRLFEDDNRTISFAQSLVSAGCELLAVHCRRRVDEHSGPPDLVAGTKLVNALSVPVIINGVSIRSVTDVIDALEMTGAHGVMVAREFLANPRLLQSSQQVDPAILAAEYLDYAEQCPPPSRKFIETHLRWIFRAELQPQKPYSDDYTDWRKRLWTFLVRPYVETIDQFRQVVVLYAKLNGSECPPSLKMLPEPSFQSIRHHGGHCYQSSTTVDEHQGEALANLFE
jgi:tRNA-dihydrouridine synthase